MGFLEFYLSAEGTKECCCVAYLIYFILFVGAARTSIFVMNLVSMLYRHFIRKASNFMKTYGDKDSWVVVTGGSDGIGEQFCHDLAKHGFNICIIARNEQKINEKLKLIQEKSGKQIKTRCVVADLSALTKISEYQRIADQVNDLDIAMLLLNAGAALMGPYSDQTNEEIEQTVTINALHPAYLTKVLLKKMLARKKRSAIIVTSSGLGSLPIPGMIPYSMSKSFSSFLLQALAIELKGKIDCMSFECGETSTKLLRKKPSLTVVTVDKATKACLRDLGSTNRTFGTLIHELMMHVKYPKIVSSAFQNVMNKTAPKILKKIRERQAQEKQSQ